MVDLLPSPSFSLSSHYNCALVGERSIVIMDMCVCVLCVPVCEHISGTTRLIFTQFIVHVTAMARSSSGGLAIHCVYFRFMDDVVFIDNGQE